MIGKACQELLGKVQAGDERRVPFQVMFEAMEVEGIIKKRVIQGETWGTRGLPTFIPISKITQGP